MKPRPTQRPVKDRLQEKVVAIGDKSTLTQAKQRRDSAQVKPFVGKVFYLDLPSNRKAETLENDIKELGGTVTQFFGKDIKYLVSNKREARYAQYLRRDSPRPIPSPDSGPSSAYPPRPNPHPSGSPMDNVKGRSHTQTDTFATSRLGKSLLDRAVKEQKTILSNALEWGVKILHIDEVIAYVEKKKKNVINQCTVTTAVKTNAKAESIRSQGFQKFKGGRLSKPFVKVEDSSRHYRPICLNLPNMPELNLKTVPPCSPFSVGDKDRSGKRQRGHRFLGDRAARASASEEEGRGRPRKNRDKKRGGYCECCMIKYDNLTVHLQSECHKAFSRSDEYSVVDRVISTLHCKFIPIKTKANRQCSMTHGPYAKTEQRHEADVDTTDTKEGQDTLWAVPECGELPRRHSLKCSSVRGSAPIIHSESDKKNCDNDSDRSQPKHKYLSRKRPCRQRSPNILSHRAELAQMPGPEAETDSRGEALTSNPAISSRVAQADLERHRTHPDKNVWAALTLKTDLQHGFPSTSVTAASSQQEVSLKIQDSSCMESVEARHVLPEETTGVSECAGAPVPTQSHSPESMVQYSTVPKMDFRRRKRRKLDTKMTYQKYPKSDDVPGNSILNLWQLFQSSEDMDLDFLGFED